MQGGNGGDSVMQELFGPSDLSTKTAEDEVEKHTFPLMSHNAYVTAVVFLSFALAMATTGLVLEAVKYSQATTTADTFEQYDIQVVLPKLNNTASDGGTAVFSDKCFSCTVDVVLNQKTGNPEPGTNRKWRFKGVMRQTDKQRKKMQFSSGAWIGDLGMIFENTADVSKMKAYVQTPKRNGHDTQYFAEGARLATYDKYGGTSGSTLSVVPSTDEVSGSATGRCTSALAALDGPVYNAFKSSPNKKAICTCIKDLTQPDSPATEFCVPLSVT